MSELDEHETAKKPDACVRPACASMKAMFKQSMNVTSSAKADCPPGKKKRSWLFDFKIINAVPLIGREELGRSTWTLLHAAAAYYPDIPAPHDVSAARNLIDSLAALYPCLHCVDDFRTSVKASPPRLDSRASFSVWLCEQHNLVNSKLDKPQFDCNLAKLDERWRDGQPSCFHKSSTAERPAESLGHALR
jgi:FAD-linked sulfhydryl oxidase